LNSLDNVSWIDLPSVSDNRGTLTSIEENLDIPFCIKRIFYMHQILSDRGGHAHRYTDQVAIASSGAFLFNLYDGSSKQSFRLDNPLKGLYIPRMLFIEIFQEVPDSVCLVLANTHYDKNQSIRTYQEFLDEKHVT
jgi:hypothetical protein